MPAPYFSAEMVLALPDDGNRYETVHGELLVTPAPGGRHQYVIDRIHRILGNYLAANGLDGLLGAPADISFDPDTLVQPDLFVADLTVFKRTWAWGDIATLYLAIEVVSPSSVRADREIKRRLYQEQGIAEYWVVDAEQEQIEVWTSEARFPVVQRERLSWRHPLAATECVVDVREVFAVS